MHFLDIAILICLLVLGGLGYYSGLIAQLSTPLALLAGVAAAWFFGPLLTEQIGQWFDYPLGAQILAAVTGFLGGALLVKIFAAVLKKLLGEGAGKGADRLCGLGLGLFKGLLIASTLVLITVRYGKEQFISEARLAPYIKQGAEATIEALSNSRLWQSARAWSDSARENVNKEDLRKIMDLWPISTETRKGVPFFETSAPAKNASDLKAGE